MRDVIVFINKMKIVFDLLSDEELDMYNDIYNRSTEEFISWINQKYEEYSNIINKLNEASN
jgi:succinate dehydrogenase flavin-adding protein (antitoxin of CptAB toxin-antitoxin module)